MAQLHFTVPTEYDGVMVKGFLRVYCKLSARLLVRLKKTESGILCNGKPIRTIDRLRAGDRLVLRLPEEKSVQRPQALLVPVVWEDDMVVFFDKPSHMAMYPSPGHDDGTLANAAHGYAHARGEAWLYRPVYRLDRDTSGLAAVAKNAFAAEKLAGTIQKEYWAVCQGELTGQGIVDAPIRLKAGHTIEREVGEDGVRAVTHWRALQTGNGHTLLAIRLETGRTHQIRVHFSSMGMPLAGDDFYGGSRALIKRQALHCAKANFWHPISGEKLELFCNPPEDFVSLCNQLFGMKSF